MIAKAHALSIAALILVGVGSDAQRVDERNIWVLNNTNRKISELYVSPHDSTRWGADALGRATLPHGIGTAVTFDPRITTSCVMDFKLVFDDGREQVYEDGRNVCQLLAVQFNGQTAIGLR
jgi:hypothetical protein